MTEALPGAATGTGKPAAVPPLEVLEMACVSKHARRACEDRVVVTPDIVAVLSGVTAKNGLEWRIGGRAATSGEWAVRVLECGLRAMDPERDAVEALRRLSALLAAAAHEQHADVPVEQHPAASIVLVHQHRRELWALGDCQWMVDGSRGGGRNRIDVLTGDVRAAALAAVAAGAVPPDGEDPGRAVILPFLRLCGALAGTSGEFGFGHLDGRPVLAQHVHVQRLPPGAEVVLASDGYPVLRADLASTEEALCEALADDPDCTGPLLRRTEGVTPGSRSYDDRTYVRLRVPGARAPARSLAAPSAVSAVRDALQEWDFGRARRELDRLGLDRQRLQTARRLAHAGDLLLALDLEDLDPPPQLPEPLRGRLRAVCLPQAPTEHPEGLLRSLLPTMALLLEVIEIRYQRQEMEELLSAVHLLTDALPLLAWELVLGHAGDPKSMRRLVDAHGSLWGKPQCPSTGPGRRAARAVRGASQTKQRWQHYVERSMTALGQQLSDCAACSTQCAIATAAATRGQGLTERLAPIRVLAKSSLLGLRHGSTVGHAFAVPDRSEVDAAWRETFDKLVVLVPRATDPDSHPLAGLRAVLAFVAGRPLPAEPLLADVRHSLLRMTAALPAATTELR